MNSVAAFSHEELLAFLASELIRYITGTTGQPHYVVPDGVQEVQRKLSRHLDISIGARVATVRPEVHGLWLPWRQDKGGTGSTDQEEVFDKVVLAISPAIVGDIFEPLRDLIARVPSKDVTSIAYTKGVDEYNDALGSQEQEGPNAEIINWAPTKSNSCYRFPEEVVMYIFNFEQGSDSGFLPL